jgi:hypothetical protein
LVITKSNITKQKTHKKIVIFSNKNKQTNKQQICLFRKHRNGLFKTHTVDNKLIKNQLIFLSNILKNKPFRNNTQMFFRKPRIMFYKKFNKLFFRAGRNIFVKKINFKKYLIQKFVTKHIKQIIKNN